MSFVLYPDEIVEQTVISVVHLDMLGEFLFASFKKEVP